MSDTSPRPDISNREQNKKVIARARLEFGREIADELTSCVYAAKGRANKFGLEFELSCEWVFDQFRKQNGCCAVSGVPIDPSFTKAGWRVRPYTVSLDKINPSKGYTTHNTRLVCALVNNAINQWQEPMLETICRAYLSNKYPNKYSVA